jgi:hypothetical protein
MGTGQMMLVLLSVLLFTTLIHSTLNNLIIQSEFLFKNMLLLQGEKLADRYINEIDMQIKSGIASFPSIVSTYNSNSFSVTTNYTQYNIVIDANYCSIGGDIGSPHPSNHYQRLDVRITFEYGGDTLRVGTATNPISAVFADSGI